MAKDDTQAAAGAGTARVEPRHTICGKPLPGDFACGRPEGHEDKCGEPWASMRPKDRVCFVGAPALFRLNQACRIVADAFGTAPYLVGSSLMRRDFRDVDVRLMLEDAEYDRLFRGGTMYNALWSLLCVSIAMYLTEASGLPIDFQIQRQTQANEHHKGPRNALGIFLDYPGELPSEEGCP